MLRRGEIVSNRYRVLESLGQGGFGNVYRVEDLSLRAVCALKENLDYWDEAQKQFQQEALILANLRHPNLPRVIDYFIVPAQGQYLVMDFIEGFDLQTVLDRIGQPLAEKPVLEWVCQICDAVAYLHTQNPPIIHRDIKPANIKITPGGKAMLVDFGIAKTYTPSAKTTLGARAVTAGFSPIEQYGHGATDTRADVYALGATLYTLLTARTPPESISRITGETLTAPRDLNPAISMHIEQTILRAMEIAAANRFQSVAEMRQAMMNLAPLPASAPHPTIPVGQPGSIELASSGTSSERPVAASLQRRINKTPTPPSRKTAAAIEWVTIPEGEFLFGEEDAKINLPAFQIARYPVTNRQYLLFLEANPQHPAPLGWKGREFPMGKARHPVVGVNLYDAVAFCEWLGCRLPSQEEWEKAARGPHGNLYPWGDSWADGKYCNNWDANNNGTTPVDRYPAGVSVYGVWDMVGNVWEWTTSEHQGPFMHVVRGGSWRLFSRYAVRAVQRDGLVISDARDDLGFRCARSLP